MRRSPSVGSGRKYRSHLGRPHPASQICPALVWRRGLADEEVHVVIRFFYSE